MKKKLKLAFSQLATEMQVITQKQSQELKGGTGPYSDCVIEAIAFATGMGYNDVLDAYGSYMAATYGGNPGGWEYDVVTNGMGYENTGAFASYMGLSNDGDTPQGPIGYSGSGDQSVAVIDQGGGLGHAVVLTGNASAFEYYYYDPQNGTTGTISKSDPSLIGTWGY